MGHFGSGAILMDFMLHMMLLKAWNWICLQVISGNMLFITCKREKILDFFSLREKEDLIDLLRDMVGEIGLDCNSTELNDLYSELCNGLKGIKTSKSLDLKVLIYFNEGDLDFVCNLICCIFW